MRKLFIIFTIAFSLLLFGCQNDNSNNTHIDLDEASKQIELPTETTKDLDLFTSFEFEGTTLSVTWWSNNELYIKTNGQITRPSFEVGDVSVTLKARISNNIETKVLEFIVVVVALDEVIEEPELIYFDVLFLVDDTEFNKQNILKDSLAQKPTNPTKDGYVFYGWYLDKEFENSFNFNTPITSDLTLYAKLVMQDEGLFNEDFEKYSSLDELVNVWDVKNQDAFLFETNNTKLLKATETTEEATLTKDFDQLGFGRYILVYDFTQGAGGASFTIELTTDSKRVFTVGANRSNRFTYRNGDGAETAVPKSQLSVSPNLKYQALIVIDTNQSKYKYFVKIVDELIEITPKGGIDFMIDGPLNGIKIRTVGTTTKVQEPYVYLDNMFIELSGDFADTKSPHDPEEPINWPTRIQEIIDDISFYTYSVKYNLSLPTNVDGVTLTWESSNQEVLSNQGVVTRGSEDVVVTLKVVASIYNFEDQKEFEFIILKTQEEKVFEITDYDVLGFAEGKVSIPNISEDDPSYYKVSNEIEFLDAIKAENNSKNGTHAARIIEITADLNLGYEEVIKKYPQVADDYRSIFQTHNTPSLHPILIESGISKIRLENRNGSNAKYNEGLMIFSKNKNTIKHATFSVKRAKNIIIRNLKFDELWEWDESGNYDNKDWDYFTVESTSGIWFDHIELGKAYDGLIDFKYGTPAVDGATFTNLHFNFQPNAFIKAQLLHFENNGGSSKYQKLRTAGMSIDEITKLVSFQKKGFLLGGSAFKSNITELTIANSTIINLQDRFPRLRGDVDGLGGDVHLFNNYYDASDVANMKIDAQNKWNQILSTSEFSNMLTNQAIVTTENGAILAENNVFKGVTQVIKSNQTRPGDLRYTGKYLVLNSIHELYGKTFIGSSLDPNSPFVPANSDPILPFSFNAFEVLPYEYENKLVEPISLFEYLIEINKQTNINQIDWLKVKQ